MKAIKNGMDNMWRIYLGLNPIVRKDSRLAGGEIVAAQEKKN